MVVENFFYQLHSNANVVMVDLPLREWLRLANLKPYFKYFKQTFLFGLLAGFIGLYCLYIAKLIRDVQDYQTLFTTPQAGTSLLLYAKTGFPKFSVHGYPLAVYKFARVPQNFSIKNTRSINPKPRSNTKKVFRNLEGILSHNSFEYQKKKRSAPQFGRDIVPEFD